MGSVRMKRIVKLACFNALLLYFIWNFAITVADEELETTTKTSVKLSEILKNISIASSTPRAESYGTLAALKFPIKRNARIRRIRVSHRRENSSSPVESSGDGATDESKSKVANFRQPKSLQPISKISGIVDGGKKNPQDLIRNALLNHTLAHGGEQDLDKLVFSNLPNGSKLVLRTVRIIRTDEDGNPMDESEKAQPTYWDVTLANATDLHDQDVEESVTESDETDESEEEAEDENGKREFRENATNREMGLPNALKSTTDQTILGEDSSVVKRVRGVRKRPDLLSSGSHSAVNYHQLNDYGTAGREKEHGTTNFHGNTHGNTHKQTYTITDGKDVKPYHGTEKGSTDYANDHGKSNKDQGERFKSSKRKNKGRKVTGFKRVYHKEEYQRTEHFFDDEEAKKIAESFGLSEAKEASNHGTKDDKRKYQGVRTDYLDGKKHENEHGTHDGYNKGQHTSYKDSEKHSHHSNYGKSLSHGSSPHHNNNNHHGYDYQQNDHSNHNHSPQQQQEQHVEYHPNHNYHGSYSSPKKSTISQVPSSLLGQLGGARSLAAIIPAPMAHSFSVTEFAPFVGESVSTSDPTKMTVTVHSLPESSFDIGNHTYPQQNYSNEQEYNNYEDNDGVVYNQRKKPKRKRPRQKKIYFSPKHRPVVEDTNLQNSNEQPVRDLGLTSPPKNYPLVSYPVSSVSDIINSHDNNKDTGQLAGENETKYTPYAPNFGPPPPTKSTSYIVAPQEHNGGNPGQHQKMPWLWPPRRQKRPRPMTYSPIKMQLLSQQSSAHPKMRNQMHLAGIPLRHASAFHRLGNRHHHYSTLKHHPKLLHPYEISTRKSDSLEYDNDNQTSLYSHTDNDSAHYFNHNQRYAKHHLTSTINPLKNNNGNRNNNNGVRNTLIDAVPGVYSTVIKVLPATMLNINDSNFQQGIYNPQLNTIHTGQASVTVTQRPFSAADTISITTAHPQHFHHQALPSQQQEHRPFLPKKRWLTFSFNLGNPNFKLGNEFGPSQHPFGHNSQKASNLMQGIRNGILKPFGRGKHALLSSPTVISQQNYPHHGKLLHHPQNQAILMRHPMMHKRPHLRHPIFAHNVASYENFGDQSPTPVVREMLSSPSKKTVIEEFRSSSSALSPPSAASVRKSERPKFFYNYKLNEVENSTSTDPSEHKGHDDAERRGDLSPAPKPTLKVVNTLTTLPISSSTTASLTSTKEPDARKMGKNPTQPSPFINGIMDSVADFFGRVG